MLKALDALQIDEPRRCRLGGVDKEVFEIKVVMREARSMEPPRRGRNSSQRLKSGFRIAGKNVRRCKALTMREPEFIGRHRVAK